MLHLVYRAFFYIYIHSCSNLEEPTTERIREQNRLLLHYKKLQLKAQVLQHRKDRCRKLADQLAATEATKTDSTCVEPASAAADKPVINASANKAPATKAPATMPAATNDDEGFIKICKKSWRRLVAEGLPPTTAPVANTLPVATPSPTRCTSYVGTETDSDSSIMGLLFASDTESPKKTTGHSGKRKSPPLARAQTKITKTEHSAVATLAEDIPVAQYVSNPTRYNPPIPQTIVDQWMRLDQVPRGCNPNPPTCKCPECPYSTTPDVVPTMMIRYNLLLKLWFVEKSLFGV